LASAARCRASGGDRDLYDAPGRQAKGAPGGREVRRLPDLDAIFLGDGEELAVRAELRIFRFQVLIRDDEASDLSPTTDLQHHEVTGVLHECHVGTARAL
jgi:hypothetical protein